MLQEVLQVVLAGALGALAALLAAWSVQTRYRSRAEQLARLEVELREARDTILVAEGVRAEIARAEELHDRVRHAMAQLGEVEARSQEAEQTAKRLEATIDIRRTQLEKLEERVQKLQQQVSDFEARKMARDGMLAEVERLELKRDALEEQRRKTEEAIQQQGLRAARVAQFEARLERVESDTERAEQRLLELQRQRAQLDGEVAGLTAQRGQLEDDIQARRDELAQLDARLESVEAGRAELRRLQAEEVRAEFTRAQELHQKVRHANGQLGELEARIAAAEQTATRLETLIDIRTTKSTELLQRIEDQQRQVADLEALKVARDTVLAEVARLEQRLESLELQRRKTEEVIQQQGLRAARTADYEARLERARADAERVEQRLQELQRERAQLDGQVASLSAQCGQIEDGLQVRRDELEQLEARLKRIEPDRAELKMLEQSLAQLREVQVHESQSLEQTREHLRELQQNVLATEKQLQDAQTQLLQRIPEFQVKLDAAEDSQVWGSLRSPVFAYDYFSEIAQEADEAVYLRSFSNALQEEGYHYPDRVIDAFHTSLKISDIASLTVLAGVSGTGKSLLPRLYARHFGIHDLVIPVQPRWDSPHDLLGHYNFLEQRYRATQLARALWQFERFNRSDDEDSESADLSDYMLLVLFDEMNLARVEYYFSELLSKLEMRAGLDTGNAEQRHRAEIVFDTGQAVGGPTVYPDLNILFVGTMNEDESTQTLSDKVLDRANVLRFSSPRQFAGNQQGVGKPSEEALTFEDWRGWQAQAEALEFADQAIREPLQRLNQALRSMGKPFGHRIFQSVARYVANYPQREYDADRARELALSDQIAQRIFPKLRGVDCKDERVAEGLDEIQTIVAGLRDDPTSEAFEMARGGDYFLWNGVVWNAQRV